jgi:hypothetical protein
MVPYDDFTPHGYLDNPYHSWKLNPSGVLRSLAPLGMGWHMPNLGSYARNQFQYTAHLMLGLRIGETVLITPDDFKQHGCTIVSHLHTKNRFEYTCTIPSHQLTLTARYFLIEENTLGCIVTLAALQLVSVTCFVMHQHTHNPYTSRLWEHGLYVMKGPQDGICMLGIASEGDVFTHGARPANTGAFSFGEMGCVQSLEDALNWARGMTVPQPGVTTHDEETGWQSRIVILPCHTTLEGGTEQSEQIINVVLTRGVSQDQSYQRWMDGIEEIALAESDHRVDDERFWEQAPQLTGNWPEYWRRGLVYDLETLRMVVRPSLGVVDHFFDGMQVQAPRLVLAEAAMDMLFLSYADPDLAAEVILGHFENALRSNLPCMREDGSFNMVADDGQICGTAPEWGFPVWCCDRIFRRTGNVHWLGRLYPGVAAYLRWWLEQRCDAEGYLVYACSWESGQDVSSRFGPQQTGGTMIQHVRPVDLQASMAQGAAIVAHWAALLAQHEESTGTIDFAQEAEAWQDIANEFAVKTSMMWHEGWFRDYDVVAQEWSSQADTMHLSPVFCGVADWGHVEQLLEYFSHPPMHSGWAPLSWPPVVLMLVEAASAAGRTQEAAELAYRFIDASYRSTDRRELDEHGGLPGVTREYLGTVAAERLGETSYVNAGIEGYGWGALSVHLLLRYLLGLREDKVDTIIIAPQLPQVLRHEGATYHVEPVPWGNYTLSIECTVRDSQSYTLRLLSTKKAKEDVAGLEADEGMPQQSTRAQEHVWDGKWGEEHTIVLELPD